MKTKGTPPTAEKLLSVLIELYARRKRVDITYEIIDEAEEEEDDEVHGRA